MFEFLDPEYMNVSQSFFCFFDLPPLPVEVPLNTMSRHTRAITTVGAAEDTIFRALVSDNNAVEAIGLCGLPRLRKTVLLQSSMI